MEISKPFLTLPKKITKQRQLENKQFATSFIEFRKNTLNLNFSEPESDPKRDVYKTDYYQTSKESVTQNLRYYVNHLKNSIFEKNLFRVWEKIISIQLYRIWRQVTRSAGSWEIF